MKNFDAAISNNDKMTSDNRLWKNLHAEIRDGLNKTSPITLEEDYQSYDHLLAVIRSYKPRYDYSSWSYVVAALEEIWSEISQVLSYGMSLGNYDLVSDLFHEVRRFMQLTKKPLRIEVATWLIQEADKYVYATSILSTLSAFSLLAWIRTSCGREQDLSLAKHYLQISWALYEKNKDSIPIDLVAELYENRIRVDIRSRKLESAQDLITRGKKRIYEMSNSCATKRPRLTQRCVIPFEYNQGLIHYLRNEYVDAKNIFQYVRDEAELIGWTRVEAGATSWIATIAKQQCEYQEGQDLLANIEIPDEQRRAYIHSVLAAIADAQGNREEARRQKEDASIIFKRYDVRYEDMMTRDLAISGY